MDFQILDFLKYSGVPNSFDLPLEFPWYMDLLDFLGFAEFHGFAGFLFLYLLFSGLSKFLVSKSNFENFCRIGLIWWIMDLWLGEKLPVLGFAHAFLPNAWRHWRSIGSSRIREQLSQTQRLQRNHSVCYRQINKFWIDWQSIIDQNFDQNP